MASAGSGKYGSRWGANLPPPHAILAAKRLANTGIPRPAASLPAAAIPAQQRAAAEQQSGRLWAAQYSSRFRARSRPRVPRSFEWSHHPRLARLAHEKSAGTIRVAICPGGAHAARMAAAASSPISSALSKLGCNSKPGARTLRYRPRAERRKAGARGVLPRCSPPATAPSARYESW